MLTINTSEADLTQEKNKSFLSKILIQISKCHEFFADQLQILPFEKEAC